MDHDRFEYFARREAEERAKAETCCPQVRSVHIAMADLDASRTRTARALSAHFWSPLQVTDGYGPRSD